MIATRRPGPASRTAATTTAVTIRLLAGLTAAGLCGCGPPAGSERPPLPDGASHAALTGATCAGHRVVSLHASPVESCRAIPGVLGRWVGEAVLRHRDATYCGYQWQSDPGGTAAPPELQILAAHRLAFDVDCPVAAPAAAPARPDWKPLRDNTRAQAGWVATLPAEDPEGRVTVAIVDSAARPYGDLASDRDGHGRAVGRVVGDLSCADPRSLACSQRIVNQLALPHVTESETDLVSGGYYGTRGELARAIMHALDQGQSGFASQLSRIHRLIITLSLGWERTHELTSRLGQGRPPLTSDVVRLALTRASCLGALVVAAAGNATGPDSTGALLPAAWEAVAAPDAAACHRLGWDWSARELSAAVGPYRPLLYAVGAVDEHDRPLSTTRPGSQPRLVAHGSGVVAAEWRPSPDGRTLVQSGTSMATAVVAGAAAAAWAHAPGLGAHQVMDAIYGSGVELGGPSTSSPAVVELCLGGGPCPSFRLRRASVCNALAAVAPAAGVTCSTVPAFAGKAPGLVPVGGLPPPLNTSACAAPGCALTADEVTSLKPWVGPQPGWPRCDVCFLSLAWNWLGIWLAPGVGADLDALILTTFTPSGISSGVIVPPATGFPDAFAVNAPVPADTWGAMLTFYLDFFGLSITSQEAIIVQ